MKKNKILSILILVFALMIALTPTTAYAKTSKTSQKQLTYNYASKKAGEIKKLADRWGWDFSAKIEKKTAGECRVVLYFENEDYYLNITQTVRKVGKKYQTAYRWKGKRVTKSGINKTLKKYRCT